MWKKLLLWFWKSGLAEKAAEAGISKITKKKQASDDNSGGAAKD